MFEDRIEINDAYENNLKHVNVAIPKGKLIVFAGVSGSGKSSLVFDTLAVEGSREWQSFYTQYVRNKLPHYERPHVGSIQNLTPVVVIDQKQLMGNSRSTVGSITDLSPLMRLMFSRIAKPSLGGSMTYNPHHPSGTCPVCSGLKEVASLNEDALFDRSRSLNEDAIRFSQFAKGWQSLLYKTNGVLDPDKKLEDYSEEEWKFLKYGSEEPLKIEIRSNNTGRVDRVDYEGVVTRFERVYLKRDISKLKQALQDEIHSFVTMQPCTTCQGSGLNPEVLESRIGSYNIVEMNNMNIEELIEVLKTIDDPIGKSIASQILGKLEAMVKIGVGYLNLSRAADTLSGGELQRLKLVRHLGSSLSNITYVFDEPTSGLHPHDAKRIGDILLEIKEKHNNVLVVEHSKQMMRLADEIIEMGPLAGNKGGEKVFQGNIQELIKTDTITSKVLKRHLEINKTPKTYTETYDIKNASLNNLKNVDVSIPKGVLTAISGVAGSGKSSLMKVFSKEYPESIIISQKPIGTSIRSTPATYTGVMDQIRKIFAKANNTTPSMFSFNSKGACPICKGKGVITYDMAFSDSVEVVCEECQGHRYNKSVLDYKYKDKNIEDVLTLTIEESIEFFEDKKIKKELQGLLDVGLGYMTLGQPTSTLSGGEVQRVKLASRLNEEGHIYILDEPSTGLHDYDVDILLELLRKLVDKGNTVIVIEHRLELIANADYNIEMGEEGGSKGGKIVFTGTPEELLSSSTLTASYLKEEL